MSTEAVLAIILAVFVLLLGGAVVWIVVLYSKRSIATAQNDFLKNLLKAKGMSSEELVKELGKVTSGSYGAGGSGDTDPWVSTSSNPK